MGRCFRIKSWAVRFIVGFLFLIPGLSADEVVRVMAANLTSGNFQAYQTDGIRIFQGLQPDIVLIQEFNYRDGSLRDLVDEAFGEAFVYYVEGGGEQIPNGIVSRYPIVASGEWVDSEVSNRDFAWARIDIPGDRDLWAVSVHFLTTGSSVRNAQAAALLNYIQNNVPEDVYLVVGGDFNTDNFNESALSTLSGVVTVNGRPADQNGVTGTNASRAKPYDQVLPGPDLVELELPLSIAGHGDTYAEGLVFDSRVFTPLSAVSPVQFNDSGNSGMQHMAVIRDFLIPTGMEGPEPAAYPTDFEGVATDRLIVLTWTDVTRTPLPEGYLILASDQATLGTPVDGPPIVTDGDLSDGIAQVTVPAGQGAAEFTGLSAATNYFFQIYPYTVVDGAGVYKTDSIVPSLELSTLPPEGSVLGPPELESVYYPHASGFTLTWAVDPGADSYRLDVSESTTFSGGAQLLIKENFDASTSAPEGWADSGTGDSNHSTHHQSAPYARAMSRDTSLATPGVDFPVELAFYVDASNNGDGQTGTVSYALGAGPWQLLHSFQVSRDRNREVVDLTAVPGLSEQTDVRFRFESGFNTWYLDDVEVTGFSGLDFVTGYADRGVGKVDFFAVQGLEADTDYYFRLRAENDFFTSPNSATGMFRTTASGTPFSVWADENGLGAVTHISDFDGDDLTDFTEYVFATNPKAATTQSDYLAMETTAEGLRVTFQKSKAPELEWHYFGSSELTDFGPALEAGTGPGQYEQLSQVDLGPYKEVTLHVNTAGAARYFFKIGVQMPTIDF